MVSGLDPAHEPIAHGMTAAARARRPLFARALQRRRGWWHAGECAHVAEGASLPIRVDNTFTDGEITT
jgi:hypothetical protein